MAKVLLVDPEMTMVQMVGELLRSDGHQVIPWTNGLTAAEKLSAIAPELVIATLGSEKTRATVLNVLQKARALNPPALVIVMTATGSLDTAMEAMKKGAYDYLNKPFTLDELRLRVQRALSHHTALAENLSLRKKCQSEHHFYQIVTRSRRMQDLLTLIERLADSDRSLLIRGAKGTGKQRLARTIHFNSRRRFGPFIAVHGSALPEHLLEEELFGQRKAPSSSDADEKIGLFKEAEGGTLFLTEIASLSVSLQTRLLDVLEDGVIRIPGENAPASIDVRVLAASDQPLEQKVASGGFLGELYRRLNEIPIVLPTLSERPEDIPLLVSHFFEGKIHPRSGKPYVIARQVIDVCCAYDWPGNIRELENALEHACILCQDGAIQPADLPRSFQQLRSVSEQVDPTEDQNGLGELRARPNEPRQDRRDPSTEGRGLDLTSGAGEPLSLKKFLRDQEISYLHRTLAHVGGSKERAAELLGISLATIYRKLSDLNGSLTPF